MDKILLFAGTTEGRKLCEFLIENGYHIDVCVASPYGQILLPNSELLTIHMGKLDREQIFRLLVSGEYTIALDATHPYAVEVSENIKAACVGSHAEYLRIIREELEISSGIWVDSIHDAVNYLSGKDGNVFVTTGSKDLKSYTELDDYKERFIFRVLPSAEAMIACHSFQVPPQHIIGIQGPVSEELNYAMFTHYNISHLVTKESGNPGGFQEKIKAAERAGVIPVIIRRPEKELGITISQILSRMTIQMEGGNGTEQSDSTVCQ